MPKQLGRCWETNLILFSNFPYSLPTHHPTSLSIFPHSIKHRCSFMLPPVILSFLISFPFFYLFSTGCISLWTRHYTVFQPPHPRVSGPNLCIRFNDTSKIISAITQHSLLLPNFSSVLSFPFYATSHTLKSTYYYA